MGVVAPMSLPENVDRETDRILKDTVASLRKDGIIYRGVIYVLLIVTADGPQLLEYNCHFGDPETEVNAVHKFSSQFFKRLFAH
ncbi:unnamed protein product [Haemonchus placei]|uniref:GARS_A domain-containing protein n=1 Tax=Haemonchus placei TaxID=6290 RepID=A0A0N4XBP1_HAEPC|nr:unnamed protein product [Haemonchus placei]